MKDREKLVRDAGPDWRERATELGVDPDHPNELDYWIRLDRAKAIIDSFRYHQPTPEQIERIAAVRQAHIACAKVILQSSAIGPDQTAALRLLHESMMTTNKAIVNEKGGA